MKTNDASQSILKVLAKSLLALLLTAALVFLCAGKLAYWQGILYLSLTALMALAAWLGVADDPSLIRERMRPGPGVKAWDKLYWALSTPLFLISLGLSAADGGRFRTAAPLPFWIPLAASVFYLMGQFLFVWAKRTNRYFSSVARIQSDRGQTVCQNGPYRLVRHPGYLGGLLYSLATPLILGSVLGLIPAALTALLMIVRTALEDAMLTAELPGYRDYRSRVKHRLIPYIW